MFDGISKLYGDGAQRLASAHVAVVGLGGVGSWAVEALARTGMGALTLVDGDDVCVSNLNRQLHALTSTVGRPKAEVLAERVRQIDAACCVTVEQAFVNVHTVDAFAERRFDYVIDCIDGVTSKAALIAACVKRSVPVISCGGAAGKIEPSLVRIADLSATYHDRLLTFVRKKLRHRFGFPARGQLFGVPCVFSPEPVDEIAPPPVEDDEVDGEGDGPVCETRLGSAVFITGTFGFVAAARVVNDLTGRIHRPVPGPPPPPPRAKPQRNA